MKNPELESVKSRNEAASIESEIRKVGKFNIPFLPEQRKLAAAIATKIASNGMSGYPMLSLYLRFNGLTLSAPFEFAPSRVKNAGI